MLLPTGLPITEHRLENRPPEDRGRPAPPVLQSERPNVRSSPGRVRNLVRDASRGIKLQIPLPPQVVNRARRTPKTPSHALRREHERSHGVPTGHPWAFLRRLLNGVFEKNLEDGCWEEAIPKHLSVLPYNIHRRDHQRVSLPAALCTA
eukprot:6410345-Pyramimonas_sp.AAC.1